MDRHVWTDEETETFVGFMEELVSEGRIADAGQFKLGSFEKLTAERFPACSGFGWDDVKQCVVVDNKEILAAYMKKQGVRLYTPGKHFPLYPRLEKIFCKDRENGVAAICDNDAEEEVQQDGNEEVDAEDMDMFNSSHDFSDFLLQQSNSVPSSSEKK
ncbi:hypothetical protein S83_007698 [Arachis hypogaea]|nr:Myb/SANT-like domain-containing protein [Arachis hypogaea]